MTFDEWFQSKQGEPYDSMYPFARDAFEAGKLEVLHQPADDTALNNLLAEGQAREKVLRDALKKLACLGNGDRHGNSIGNTIAIAAYDQPSDDTALNNLLAEGQAREKVLRDALDHVVDSMTVGDRFTNAGQGVLDALAQPADDTALRAALANERERCADHIGGRHWTVNSGSMFAEEIRVLGDE